MADEIERLEAELADYEKTVVGLRQEIERLKAELEKWRVNCMEDGACIRDAKD